MTDEQISEGILLDHQFGYDVVLLTRVIQRPIHEILHAMRVVQSHEFNAHIFHPAVMRRPSSALLGQGFKLQMPDREVHVRGIYPDERIVRNYIRALNARADNGRHVVPRVLRVYVPHINQNGTPKAISQLPDETIQLLRSAQLTSGQTLFEVRELNTREDYRGAAAELGIPDANFFNFLIFVSDWTGTNLEEFLAVHANDPEAQHAVGQALGETLAALHNHDLIAGDTHLGQFIVDQEDGRYLILRVDLNNIYMVNEANQISAGLDNRAIERGEIVGRLPQPAREGFLQAYTHFRRAEGDQKGPTAKSDARLVDELVRRADIRFFFGESSTGLNKALQETAGWRKDIWSSFGPRSEERL